MLVFLGTSTTSAGPITPKINYRSFWFRECNDNAIFNIKSTDIQLIKESAEANHGIGSHLYANFYS